MRKWNANKRRREDVGTNGAGILFVVYAQLSSIYAQLRVKYAQLSSIYAQLKAKYAKLHKFTEKPQKIGH
ncbi:hypothetical protein [Planomicrobium okeanokoites]|uniref:Uncharacterized protein n=1 Tax=Planomicrobium okeanokoites TaxID=244 RepID=A0ABV7KJ81_PLAOK|nr:hypothetical protein [Planomicrobium okeanokoites]TAA68963.1 hypothetical protein D2910_11090 [Planomicrobium okeanokoites]